MSLWMVGEVRCLSCGHSERRAVDLLEVATQPGACSACGSSSLDYQFNVFHWSWITERLALGGRVPDRNAMRQLREAGITHILSVAPEADEHEMATEMGIQFRLTGCLDDYEPKPAGLLSDAVDYVLAALKEPNAKVHIHCFSGARRSVMVMLAVLRSQGMPLEEAMRLLSEKRAAAHFVPAYVESVENFVRQRRKAGAKGT